MDEPQALDFSPSGQMRSPAARGIQILLDSLPYFAFLVDEDWNFITGNEALARARGLSVRELPGKKCFQVIHDTDSPLETCVCKEVKRSHAPHTIEYSPPNLRTCFSCMAAPTAFISPNGKRIIFHTIVDITEQQQTKAELSRAFEHHKALGNIMEEVQSCQDNVQVLETVVDHVLPLSWMGLTASAAAFLVDGDHLRLVVDRNLDPELVPRCSQLRLGECLCGIAAQQNEVIICSTVSDQHTIRFDGMQDHGHAVLPFSYGNSVLGVLNFYIKADEYLDTYRQKFLEAIATFTGATLHTKQIQSQMVQADRLASMGGLAAGVAHEINNPLTYVIYNLESLQRDLPSLVATALRCLARIKEHEGETVYAELTKEIQGLLGSRGLEDLELRTSEAIEGATRIRDIVRDLKTFSRVEQAELTPVDLNNVIECAINMVFNEIKYRARLVRDLGKLPEILSNDGRMSQVFLNLLINATHSFKDEDPSFNEIRIRTWASDESVFVEVRDNGSGIPKRDLPRLFEPFFSTKPVGVGSGLGLAISKDIVQGLHGSIEVQSEVGRGTCFTLSFPITITEHDEAARHTGPPSEDPALGRHRVLIIDDESLVANSMARVLEEDFDVVIATSGAAGKRILEQDTAFDLILCDVMMPEVSGIDIYELLAATSPALAARMIFITGGAFTPRAREFLRLVPNIHIEKPLEPRNLRNLAREMARDTSSTAR